MKNIFSLLDREDLRLNCLTINSKTYRVDEEHIFWRYMTMTDEAPLSDMNDQDIVKTAETILQSVSKARDMIRNIIYGQDRVVDLALITILSGGHGLLVGVPGLAKTKLVETLGIVLGLNANRIQFTPDLMPSDILGSEVLDENDEGKRFFRFIQGPIFTQLLMADEINRASPRTQSALLQAMQEKHVSISGERHDLSSPFHVLATQNPIEQEGTYPLPEAQLDRFLLQIDVDYPDWESERRILLETTGTRETKAVPVLHTRLLLHAQNFVREMPVGDNVVKAILDIVRMARPMEGGSTVSQKLLWGPGPRASQALTLAVRARALLQGRVAPSVDDVYALAGPVIKHRIALNFAARAEGLTINSVIDELIQSAKGETTE